MNKNSRNILDSSFRLVRGAVSWLQELQGPIYTIVLSGVGRCGKSEIASRLAALLAGDPNLAPFRSAPDYEPVTIGVQAYPIRREGGGTWLILDTEGTDNGSTEMHSRLLALLGSLSSALLFVDAQTFNTRVISALARAAGYSSLVMNQNQWPELFVVINMNPLGDLAASVLEDNLKSRPNDALNVDRQTVSLAYQHRNLYSLPYFGATFGAKMNDVKNGIVSSPFLVPFTAQAIVERINAVHDIIDKNPQLFGQDNGTIYSSVMEHIVQQHRRTLMVEYQERAAHLPRDGRTSDDDIRKQHGEIVAIILQRFDDLTESLNVADIAETERGKMVDDTEASLLGILLVNQDQRQVTSISEEVKEETIGDERHIMAGRSERTVWFHTDIDITVRVYRLKITYSRRRTVFKNGVETFTAWVEKARSDTLIREYTVSYTEMSTLGHITCGVVSFAVTAGLAIVTAGASIPAAIAIGAATGIPAGINGTVEANVSFPIGNPAPPTQPSTQPNTGEPTSDPSDGPTAPKNDNTNRAPSSTPSPTKPNGPPPKITMDFAMLGSLSSNFESGGNPGAINKDKKDPGGFSYGIYQFATKKGSATEFLNWLNAHTDYKPMYDSLVKDQAKPGTLDFNKHWESLAKTDGPTFGYAQHKFWVETAFIPALSNISQQVPIINWLNASPVLHDVLFSTVVQHGKSGALDIVSKAIGSSSGPLSESDVIKKIYDERGRRGENGQLVHFKKSATKTQENIAKRFRAENQLGQQRLKEWETHINTHPSEPFKPNWNIPHKPTKAVPDPQPTDIQPIVVP